MGAWGPGSFENDDAMDWVTELEDYATDSLIIAALNTVIDLFHIKFLALFKVNRGNL